MRYVVKKHTMYRADHAFHSWEIRDMMNLSTCGEGRRVAIFYREVDALAYCDHLNK